MTDSRPVSFADVEDVANDLQELRSVVHLLSLIGNPKTCINPEALSYVFGFIEGEIKKTQDAIYTLCDRMRDARKEGKAVCSEVHPTICYTDFPGKPGQSTR